MQELSFVVSCLQGSGLLMQIQEPVCNLLIQVTMLSLLWTCTACGCFFVFRLFYAGACEGQMPEILTMIQIKKLTPAPAVLCMVCVVSFKYNTVKLLQLCIYVCKSLYACYFHGNNWNNMSQFIMLDMVTSVVQQFS